MKAHSIPRSRSIDPAYPHGCGTTRRIIRSRRGFTLVEVAVGVALISALALAVIGASLQARRMSEEAIIQNAATSIVYGLVEQMKTLNLSDEAVFNHLPSPADGDSPSPHVKVRVDNSTTTGVFLVVTAGAAPDTTPAQDATAVSVGATSNTVGPFDLSQTTGVTIQPLTIDLWLWIEPDYQPTAMAPMTRVTLVYTYQINLGTGVRTYRDSVRFVRANRQVPRAS